MNQKKTTQQLLAENRRARFDYDILETFEAGIELVGHEVKSIKAGRLNLRGSYATFHKGQLLLTNAQIPPYQPNNVPESYDPARSRRLLLHKQELETLLGKLQQKSFSLLPMKAYIKHGLIKLELAIAKSRKKSDKREVIKKRDSEREMRRVQ